MVTSESNVRIARRQLNHLLEKIETIRVDSGIAEMEEEADALKEAIDAYVLTRFAAGDGYEDDDVRITKVVGHRRSWNVQKLEKLLPRAVFRRVISIKVESAKIDQEVRAGNIKLNKIKSAFEEVPNKPYTKWSNKSDDDASREAEADSLAAKLA